jgi:hypothetical protein
MPLPPLSPGAAMRGPFLPTLLLLGLAGTSMIKGDFAPERGTSTTIGVGESGARVLGARLILRARDGARDILLLLLFLSSGVGIDDALDAEEGT